MLLSTIFPVCVYNQGDVCIDLKPAAPEKVDVLCFGMQAEKGKGKQIERTPFSQSCNNQNIEKAVVAVGHGRHADAAAFVRMDHGNGEEQLVEMFCGAVFKGNVTAADRSRDQLFLGYPCIGKLAEA